MKSLTVLPQRVASASTRISPCPPSPTGSAAPDVFDRADTRPLERRPVIHPRTWQPWVQSWAVPFITAAVGALLAYAYLGSWIALIVAWVMLPLAAFAVHIARGTHLDEAVPEEPPVDMGKAGKAR